MLSVSHGRQPCRRVSGFSEVDVLYSLEVNEWNGRREPQLIVKDLRKSQDA